MRGLGRVGGTRPGQKVLDRAMRVHGGGGLTTDFGLAKMWSWARVPRLADGPAEELTFDHLVPRSRGGRTMWTNVVTACSSCNLRKSNRLPREARMFPRRPVVQPTSYQLQVNGQRFPPNYLHESWGDFLYWDCELDPS